MTTDLRAALRAACKKLHGLTPHASAAENDEIGAWQDLADAPPTVAELLPLVDATHEVHWTDADGDEWRSRCIYDRDDGQRTVIEIREYGEWADGAQDVCYPLASDFKLPATLVEVTP